MSCEIHVQVLNYMVHFVNISRGAEKYYLNLFKLI